MVKVYCASNAPNRFGVQLLIEKLHFIFSGLDIKGEVVSTWHKGGDRITTTFGKVITQDIDELMDADLLIAMYPYGNGARAEMNIGLGRDIPMIALIPPEFIIKWNAKTGWSDNFALAKFRTWEDVVYEGINVSQFEQSYDCKHIIVSSFPDLRDAIDCVNTNFIGRTNE